MGKPKKAKKGKGLDEGLEDDLFEEIEALQEGGGKKERTQENSVIDEESGDTKQKKKEKKAKKKKGGWDEDEIANDIEAMKLEDGGNVDKTPAENEENSNSIKDNENTSEQGGKKSKKAKKKNKGAWDELEDELANEIDEMKGEEKSEGKKDDTTLTEDKPVEETGGKKGKKSKKKDKGAWDQLEDELTNEIEEMTDGGKADDKKEDPTPTEEKPAEETGGKKGKKGKKKKKDAWDEDELMREVEAIESGKSLQTQEDKEAKPKEETAKPKEEAPKVDDGEEEGPVMKTAAQKRAEKKERQKEQKRKEKLKQENKKKGEEEKPQLKEESQDEEKGKGENEEPEDAKRDNEEEEEEEDDSKKKKKKKKKGAKDEEEKTKKKKPGKAQLKLMQELLEKQKEEEERLRREEEEKQRKAEEAEAKRLEELRIAQERKERKKQKEKERKENLKKLGKYLTPAQKEQKRIAEMKLAALREQGIIVPNKETEQKPQKVKYGGRVRKNKGKPQADDVNKTEEAPSGLGPEHRKIPIGEIPTEEKPENEEEKMETEEELSPRQEEESEGKDETEADEKSTEVEEEDEVAESWDQIEEDDVKDNWEEEEEEEEQKKVPKAEIKVKAAKEVSKEEEDEEEDDDEEEEDDEEEDDEEEDEDEESESESESESEEDSDEEENVTTAEKIRERAQERIRKRREENESKRSVEELRCPVICVLGHVDTGKTKILDKIRHTNVQDGEAGGITQQIGATMVPQEAIREQTKMCRQFAKKELKVEGLLIIDTPGHESFSNLRSRGSSLCDFAILVVDIMHGLEPQTIESLNLLRSRKTPFVVALNKIDRLYEWKTSPHAEVQNALKKQKIHTRDEFDERVKAVIGEFAEQGLNAALFYENPDPRSYISLVPTSAHSGDGMGNLIALILELSQSMLAKRLSFSEELQCTTMEVKALPGLGTTIDVVLVNGRLREGDTIVVAGQEGPIVTQIRGLLTTQPLKELRVKNQYVKHKEIKGAYGVKLLGKDLEKALAGLPLLVANHPDEVDILKEEIGEILEQALKSIKLSERGVYVQASTLGSLEALLEFLRTSKIPYSGINIGPVHKKDVMKASIMLEHDSQYAVILAFDVKVERDAQELADRDGIKIFQADIIYHLFDSFTKHLAELKERKRQENKHIAVFPCKLKILPNCVFNARNPIVVGVQVEGGIIKEGTPLIVPSKENLEIGVVSSLELNHKPVEMAKKGQEVCIKIENVSGDAPKMYGRHFDENDLIISRISRESIEAVKKYFREDLEKSDWQVMIELKKILRII